LIVPYYFSFINTFILLNLQLSGKSPADKNGVFAHQPEGHKKNLVIFDE
jgi:hypothetical protein